LIYSQLLYVLVAQYYSFGNMASSINSSIVLIAKSDICPSCGNLSVKEILPVQDCLCCELVEHARNLFEECVSSHPGCKLPYLPPLPSRVLDVGAAGDAHDPFLYVPENELGQRSSYVALSYCWGEDAGAFVVTTSSNIHERRAGIPLRSLPTTLREAVYITRRLNIRYLWIDALCIIQGSEEDWVKNAARMDEIYGNATLTISAASAASCTQGILTPLLYRNWKLPSDLDPDKEPINHRAWTLQERLLSRRYTSFGTEYMTWQCRTETKVRYPGVEDASGPYHLRSYHLASVLKSPSDLWLALVIDYTSRFLTNESDKLPALSGVVKTIHSHTGDEYLAGLWKNQILRQLRWRAGLTVLKPVRNQKPKKYRAPSWSWASIDGNVNFVLAGNHDSISLTKFIDCSVEPLFSKDPFGRVRSGTLVLRGPLKQATEVRWEGLNSSAELFGGDGSIKIGPVWLDIGEEYPGEEVRAEWAKMKLWCLQMSAVGGMVVALLLVEERESDNYQRAGLVYSENMDWFQDALVQTVTII
jgi:Heterokaryon incompatibility protein (HET)